LFFFGENVRLTGFLELNSILKAKYVWDLVLWKSVAVDFGTGNAATH